MRRHALCTPKGALLLLSRARDFLKTVVYQEELRLGDGPDERVRLSQTADGRKFGRGDKSFAGEQYISFGSGHLSGFTCTIYLPEVRLCSAHPDGELLPYRIELPGKTFDSKSDAEDFTALAACRHLHAIGVLDDQLFVVGRAEARAELYARLGRPHKLGSRKQNAHELALKELVVRRLPRCFEPPPALRGATAESVGDAGTLWLHAIRIDGAATGRGLLLSARSGLAAPFQLGPAGKPRRACELVQAVPVTLSLDQLAELAECHVAELDLVQAGNALEPLHRSFGCALRTPAQVVGWDHDRGTYRPERQQASGTPLSAEHATTGCSLLGDGWAALGVGARHSRLSELLQPYLAPPSSGAARPLVPVFDLDQTVWHGNCADFNAQCRSEWEVRESSEGRAERIYQEGVYWLDLHEDVPLIFAVLRGLRSCGAKFAIASATSAHDEARALLSTFGLHPDELTIEVRDARDAGEDGKTRMLQRLSERLEVEVSTLVLFDDNKQYLTECRGLGGGGRLINPADGLTADALLEGLHLHRQALEEHARQGLNEQGFTLSEMRIEKYEDRRKAQQARHGREGEAHAQADEAPARARMRSLHVDAAWWLSVPITAAGDVDWAHVRCVNEYCATCRWPTLGEINEPLVEAHLGPPQRDGARPLELCALMRRPQMHTDLISSVQLLPDGSVSGEKRSRGINIGATAATRTQQADGRHLTEHTLHRTGFDRHFVHVLPIRSAHIDTLQAIRRVV